MSIKQKYVLMGVGFGCLFPIASILIDCCIFNDGNFLWSDISSYYRKNPIHYLVLTAPLFLGIAFYIAGFNAQRQYYAVRRLKRLNENLQATNEALDSFNYHVSHDLKTVLSNTESLTMMLKKYVGTENHSKVQEITDRLLKISLSGQDTVKSFLAFSKATSVIFDENETALALKPEIEKIKETYFKDAQLELNITEQDFNKLKINKKALESLMLNLISNAIKYNDNAAVKVDILFKKKYGFKKIIVADNGIGIDTKANEDKLFKPFEKIQNNKQAEGTGVGLYLVKKIMGAYGGYVRIESVLGKGSTFILAFPNKDSA